MVSGSGAAVALLVIRGVFAILFGVLALVWPGVTAVALALVFGIYAIIDGIALLAEPKEAERRWGTILAGVLGIIAGVLTLVWPAITALTLALLVGIWAVVTGIMEISTAIRLRKWIRGELFLGIAGALSVVLGVLIFIRPDAGAVFIAVMAGIYALIFGVIMLVLAFQLYRSSRTAV
ncbi:HdeD family acid-resistance protein [Amycolatopsis sp. NPDC059027]|uniref:HdeD family acid-resistance protein n=1 Tax=unclassified Amycolatopsis TaxID=2618356 RepID=UPI0036728926